ncbi:MAG: Fur family transcriptional regulator [Nocardioides sp.]|jgi:Fur family ferric uptake transcriptional regulator
MVSAADHAWKTHLRSRGHRLTPQRERVLAAVDHLGHGTPDQVHAEVVAHAPTSSLSTTYRALTLLADLELISVVTLADRTPVYHSKQTPHHVHLSCEACGSVSDAAPGEFADLTAQLCERHGFAVSLERLVIVGRCAACREAES